MIGPSDEDTEKVSANFEKKYPGYRVIHIGQGEEPPKKYQSLEFSNEKL